MRHFPILQYIRIQDALSDFSSLSTAVSQFRPLVVYEADIQFLAESTEHEKSVCVTPMKRHRFLHSAAIFTPGVAWRAEQWHRAKKNKLFFKMLALNLPQDSSDLVWPCLTSVTQVVGTFVRSTAGQVWMKNPDINVWLSVFFGFFFF